MFRSPRVWMYAASAWLIVMGLVHGGTHAWTFVMENGIGGQHEFAMNAMKQARSSDPLQPSMWRLFRALSASYALLLGFAGSVGALLAWKDAPATVLRSFSLLSTVFWTLALCLYVFVDPVIQPIVIAVIVVPLYSLAWVTAHHEAESQHDSA